MLTKMGKHHRRAKQKAKENRIQQNARNRSKNKQQKVEYRGGLRPKTYRKAAGLLESLFKKKEK